MFANPEIFLPVMGLSRPGDMKIVRILDYKGEVSYEVLEDDIIRLMKKDMNNRYKEAKKAWTQERKAWKEKYPQIPYTKPKPISPKVSVIAKGFQTRGEAEADLALARSGGSFCIYQVVSGEKKDVGVISATEIDGFKYSLGEKYFNEIKAWLKAKEAFEKENPDKEFTQAKPVKAKIKILKKNIKTKEKAFTLSAKY